MVSDIFVTDDKVKMDTFTEEISICILIKIQFFPSNRIECSKKKAGLIFQLYALAAT
jgi:hypothetical protein